MMPYFDVFTAFGGYILALFVVYVLCIFDIIYHYWQQMLCWLLSVKHTSASLSLNEVWSAPFVRIYKKMYFIYCWQQFTMYTFNCTENWYVTSLVYGKETLLQSGNVLVLIVNHVHLLIYFSVINSNHHFLVTTFLSFWLCCLFFNNMIKMLNCLSWLLSGFLYC